MAEVPPASYNPELRYITNPASYNVQDLYIRGVLFNHDDLQGDFGLKEDKANKGIPNGYAGLDGNGDVPFATIAPIAKGGILTSADGVTNSVQTVGANNTALIADSTATRGFRWGSYDHVNLLNKGTNTHAALDTFVASKNQPGGLASLNSGTAWDGTIGPLLASRSQPGARSVAGQRPLGSYTNNGTLNGGNGPSVGNMVAIANYPSTDTSLELATGIWTAPVSGTYISDVSVSFPASANNGPGQKYRHVALHSNVKGLQVDTASMASIMADQVDYLKMVTLIKADATEQWYISCFTGGPQQPSGSGDVADSNVKWRIVQVFGYD